MLNSPSKDRTLRTGVLCLVIAVLTFICTIGTFAKYVTNGNFEDEARVAKWGIDIPSSTDIDLFQPSYKGSGAYSDQSTVNSENGDNVIAPGTKHGSKIIIANVTGNAPEVMYDFDINLVINDGSHILEMLDQFAPSKWGFNVTLPNGEYFSGLKSSQLKTFIDGLSEKDIAPNTLPSWFRQSSRAQDLKIDWYWNFGPDDTDASDTYLGNAFQSFTTDFGLTFNIAARQCQGCEPVLFAIHGVVDDGQTNAPVSGATVKFVANGGEVLASTQTNAQGEYKMEVLEGKTGHVVCTTKDKKYVSQEITVSGDTTIDVPELFEKLDPSIDVPSDVIEIAMDSSIEVKISHIGDAEWNNPTTSDASVATASFKDDQKSKEATIVIAGIKGEKDADATITVSLPTTDNYKESSKSFTVHVYGLETAKEKAINDASAAAKTLLDDLEKNTTLFKDNKNAYIDEIKDTLNNAIDDITKAKTIKEVYQLKESFDEFIESESIAIEEQTKDDEQDKFSLTFKVDKKVGEVLEKIEAIENLTVKTKDAYATELIKWDKVATESIEVADNLINAREVWNNFQETADNHLKKAQDQASRNWEITWNLDSSFKVEHDASVSLDASAYVTDQYAQKAPDASYSLSEGADSSFSISVDGKGVPFIVVAAGVEEGDYDISAIATFAAVPDYGARTSLEKQITVTVKKSGPELETIYFKDIDNTDYYPIFSSVPEGVTFYDEAEENTFNSMDASIHHAIVPKGTKITAIRTIEDTYDNVYDKGESGPKEVLPQWAADNLNSDENVETLTTDLEPSGEPIIDETGLISIVKAYGSIFYSAQFGCVWSCVVDKNSDQFAFMWGSGSAEGWVDKARTSKGSVLISREFGGEKPKPELETIYFKNIDGQNYYPVFNNVPEYTIFYDETEKHTYTSMDKNIHHAKAPKGTKIAAIRTINTDYNSVYGEEGDTGPKTVLPEWADANLKSGEKVEALTSDPEPSRMPNIYQVGLNSIVISYPDIFLNQCGHVWSCVVHEQKNMAWIWGSPSEFKWAGEFRSTKEDNSICISREFEAKM